MPYIAGDDRPALDLRARAPRATTAGELNYQITTLLLGYVDEHGLRYATINDCLGALEGAKLEFYRRLAGPYEDQKITENGDVY
jgi:hypothetical protein